MLCWLFDKLDKRLGPAWFVDVVVVLFLLAAHSLWQIAEGPPASEWIRAGNTTMSDMPMLVSNDDGTWSYGDVTLEPSKVKIEKSKFTD